MVFWRVRKIAKSNYWLRHVCPHGTTRFPLDGFSWNLIFIYFLKNCRKIQVPLKSDKNNGYFTWRSICILIISRSILLRMRNVSDRSCRGNQNTRFVSNNSFFLRSCRLWDNVEKYCRAGHATDNNMAHAHCKLDNLGHTRSQYVILIVQLQQWLQKRASMLRLLIFDCYIWSVSVTRLRWQPWVN